MSLFFSFLKRVSMTPFLIQLASISLDITHVTLKHVLSVCNGHKFCHLVFQVHPEGKFVVDLDKNIDINDVTPNCRVALRNDSYTLHKILPNKVGIQL